MGEEIARPRSSDEKTQKEPYGGVQGEGRMRAFVLSLILLIKTIIRILWRGKGGDFSGGGELCR